MVQAHLVNVQAQSRKFYIIDLLKKGGKVIVKGTWGRIGSTSKSQIKYMGDNILRAKDEFNKVLNTRYSHGYNLISSK